MDNSCTTDDIEALVTRWYFQRRQKIPDADKEWLRAYREQECVGEDLWKAPMPDVPDSERTQIGPKEKPVYGTKEFWKDWWARKKEKERVAAERAATGVVGDPKGSATGVVGDPKGSATEPEKKKGKKKGGVAEPLPTPEPTPEQPKKVKLVRKKVVVVET